MRISSVWKAVIAAVAVTSEAVVAAGADNVLDLSEQQHVVVTVVTGLIGVYGVWRVRNSASQSERMGGKS